MSHTDRVADVRSSFQPIFRCGNVTDRVADAPTEWLRSDHVSSRYFVEVPFKHELKYFACRTDLQVESVEVQLIQYAVTARKTLRYRAWTKLILL